MRTHPDTRPIGVARRVVLATTLLLAACGTNPPEQAPNHDPVTTGAYVSNESDRVVDVLALLMDVVRRRPSSVHTLVRALPPGTAVAVMVPAVYIRSANDTLCVHVVVVETIRQKIIAADECVGVEHGKPDNLIRVTPADPRPTDALWGAV